MVYGVDDNLSKSLKVKKNNRSKKRFDPTPLFMLLPATIIMCCVILYPIINAVDMSFQHYIAAQWKNRHYIGLENYIKILDDPAFSKAVVNSLKWVFITVPTQFLVGLVLALLLNRKFKGRGFVRSMCMIPWVTSGVVIALMWSWIYNANFGVLNDILKRLNIISTNVAWLSTSKTALGSQIVTMVWQGIPFFTVTLLASLQSIPVDLYEAADISGANGFQKFRYITFPFLLPTIFVTTLLRFIWVANNVDIIYQMTGGGPGFSSLTLSVYAYIKAQKTMDFGYASALAVYGTIFMVLLMVVYIKLLTKEEVER
jgi:multiple sugar transport system permease protein